MNLKQLVFIIQIILIRKNLRWNPSPNTALAFHDPDNKIQTHLQDKLITYKEISSGTPNTNKYRNADLHFFPSHDVMGIANCSYENTINITKNAVLANGSYIYDHQTLIPLQLVGNYDYEIFYNGSQRKVPLHKRACICHLKPCIPLCSNVISESYQYILNESMYDEIALFYIEMTLSNKSVVVRNIAEDFEPIVLKEFCELTYILTPEIDKTSNWTLFENGTLLRHSDQAQLRRTEYCFDIHDAIVGNDTYHLINPQVCSKNKEDLTQLEKFNYCVQVMSIVFLLLTIIAYCCLPELLDVNGKCFITYLCSLAISYGIFSFINLSQKILGTMPCLLMAYFNHYFQLSHYIWLGIISFNTWKTFSDHGYCVSYSTYAFFGYLFPLMMTLLTAWAQNINIPKSWQPGITSERCGLDVSKWAAALYLYGPCLIILVCCLIFFILTSRKMSKNKKNVAPILPPKRRSINNDDKDDETEVMKQITYTSYLRLFLLMGLSWFLDVLSYLFIVVDLKTSSTILDYVNAIQGLCIFVTFTLQGKVQKIVRDKV